MKKVLIPVLTLVVCLTVLYKWTLGFSSFTVFSYTLRSAGDIPRSFPDITLIGQDSKVFHLKDKQKYVLLNFVYLNCPNVCHKVNNQIEQVYHLFDSAQVPAKLEFVTLSFDLKNDDVRKIEKYRSFFGSDIDGWTFALPYHTSQLEFDSFLRRSGIWKYTNPQTGIINHSVYLFLIAPDNKIVKVFDPARDNNATIAEEIKSCLSEPAI